MGLWAAYVLVPTAAAPADASDWATGTGTVEGWSVFVRRHADPTEPAAPWSAVRGPMLTAVVQDSDVAALLGWYDGEDWFGCLLSGSEEEGPDEAARAGRRRLKVEAMLAWAGAAGLAGADGGRLDDILARGYVFAEEGLFAVLAELAVIGPGAAIEQVGPEPRRARPEPTGAEEQPPRYPLAMADGDASGLPRRMQTVHLAAAIDHADPSWDAFVVANELECWGRPGCVLVTSLNPIAAGTLDSRGGWQTVLATEPPIDLFHTYGALGTEDRLPALGPWHLVPPECTDVTTAVRWARANVAADLEPPAPDREALHTPEAAVWVGESSSGPARPRVRRCEPRLGCILYTYADLTQRLDELAGWLDAAHRALIDPMPSGVRRRITTQSVLGRWSNPTGDAEHWQRALERFRAGELLYLDAAADQLSGAGTPSMYRRGNLIRVECRPARVEAAGPPPADCPASVEISVARSLLDHVDGGIDTVRRLASLAAPAAEAVTGYAHAGGQYWHASPFEQRTGARWRGERLDAMSRGVHWGNLIGPGHLAAIGGLGVLQELHAQGRITRLEPWPGGLWWFEVTDDPFEPRIHHVDGLAGSLASIIGPGFTRP
ncbi:hypothetical protein AB0M46_39480 [Dactylosporangium sp. NPDC051485]|uniref:hypothetical protein n=1 Tax=Dactylosporangium sp. NPDC051485 TaxID=3154846 RepID=UPI00342EF0D8